MASLIKLTWAPATSSGLPRSARRGCTYEAYVPDPLARRSISLNGETAADVADAELAIARLNHEASGLADSEAVARLASLPDMLPAPPDALLPTRTDTGEQRAPAWPFGPESAKPSAVLLLLAPSADDDPDAEAEILLIRRVDRGGHHSGHTDDGHTHPATLKCFSCG